MNVVLCANQSGERLKPLTDRTCVSLLPVAAKPLLHYSVEALALSGLRKATVVLCEHADQVEAALGDGRRWGMELTYTFARPGEHLDATVARIRATQTGDLLVMRADVLRSPFVGTFLEKARDENTPVVAATVGGRDAGLWFVRADAGDPVGLGERTPPASASRQGGARIEIEGAGLATLDGLPDYHRANVEAVDGSLPGLVVPGRMRRPNVFVGRRSRVRERSLRGDTVCVGAQCWVERRAEVRDRVVLSEAVVVDELATLENSVVLPRTYVGRAVDVRNAIVWGGQLIRVDTGVVTEIADAFFLGELDDPGFRRRTGNLVHRVVGLLLLLLSLPLWPAMVLASLIVDRRRPFRTVRLIGNRRRARHGLRLRDRAPFNAVEAAVPSPVLRHLPKLLAVVQGHLRVVGVKPRSAGEELAEAEQWERLAEEAPAGLLGPADLLASVDAPDEELELVEAHYARTRRPLVDLRLAMIGVLALFRRRAWGFGPGRPVNDAETSARLGAIADPS